MEQPSSQMVKEAEAAAASTNGGVHFTSAIKSPPPHPPHQATQVSANESDPAVPLLPAAGLKMALTAAEITAQLAVEGEMDVLLASSHGSYQVLIFFALASCMFPVVFNDLCTIFYTLPPMESACCMPAAMMQNSSFLPPIKQSIDEWNGPVSAGQSSNQVLLPPVKTFSDEVPLLRNDSAKPATWKICDAANYPVVFATVFREDHSCAVLESLKDGLGEEEFCYTSMVHRFDKPQVQSIISEV